MWTQGTRYEADVTDAASVKEQQETVTQPTSPVIHGMRAAVGATILGVASFLPSFANDTPKQEDHVEYRVPGSRAFTEKEPEIGLLDVRVDGTEWSCVLDGCTLQGTVNAKKELEQVSIDGLTVEFSEPQSGKHLEVVLRNAIACVRDLSENCDFEVQGSTLTVHGGMRFFFAAKTPEGEIHQYVATPHDVLCLDAAKEKDRVQAVAGIAGTGKELQKVQLLLTKDLSAQAGSTNARCSTVIGAIRKQHPWTDYEYRFVNHWNTLVNAVTAASGDARAKDFAKVQSHLDAWEAFLGLPRTHDFQENYHALQKQRGELLQKQKAYREEAAVRHYEDPYSGMKVTEKESLVTPKNFVRTFYDKGEKVSEDTYEDDLLQHSQDFEKGEFARGTWYTYFPGGQLKRESDWTYPAEKWQLDHRTEHWISGQKRSDYDREKQTVRYHSKNGELIYGEDHMHDRKKRTRFMVHTDGTRYGNFTVEKQKKEKLTPDGYLDVLAARLTTSEKRDVFNENFFLYVGDEDDYWQSPTETVVRIDPQSGKMMGDCDDWAFFWRDVYHRQGKLAFVHYVTAHATCIAPEKKGGRYYAARIGTFGYNENGNQLHKAFDATKLKGYATAVEALQAVDDTFDLKYKLKADAIDVMPNPDAGTGTYSVQSAESLFARSKDKKKGD
ncbi:hypothetical protein COU77_01470 [Candidatus Peregrinibacteria bacterium CG10_big_fil_rev_8_21_14_0_10_49_16]|nr:MAG: hypothetical protein COW95_01655 [Candidatus Peregrinibacteria bacterium CG22_combo_CG10-13_8_21_14_all_49_11]PIR52227.1 MAG: hypothetical protein COU77_01470 [Candidatus Peregrinibacteria bacterium CG10_big_fil_rev_8_21_14_0_10_49_16]